MTGREELKKLLPHRAPMLLLDSARLAEDGSARGKYLVRGDEWFLQGHFPGNPIVPGVILCEMAGQTGCVLFSGQIEGKTPLFTGMNKVKFRRPVKPGDEIELECVFLRRIGEFRFIEGKAYVNGELCMCGEFSFATV